MGSSIRSTPSEIRAWEKQDREREQLREQAVNAKRMSLANKIVMAVVDKIAADIIRPGPKPEERECYVMAQELRDSNPELTALVSAILKVDAEEDK